MPDASTQVFLAIGGFVTAVSSIVAISSRRAQRAERRRFRRKMLGINDQYRLMRQDLRDAEDARSRLQRDLSKSEDNRRELDLMCQGLGEEVRRLMGGRQGQPQELDATTRAPARSLDERPPGPSPGIGSRRTPVGLPRSATGAQAGAVVGPSP